MASSKGPKVFVREATGLIKSVTLYDAIALNVSSMSTGAALATIGFTMALLPSISGVNLVYATLLGFVLSIPQVIVYTIMTQRIPRTGGDYVWISRNLHPMFACALTLMGFTLQTLSFIALSILSTVFAIGSVGVSLGYESMLPLALPGNLSGADPMSQFLLGTGIFVLLIAVNIVRPKAGYRIVSVFTAIGIVTMVLAIGTLLSAGNQGVQGYMSFLQSIGSNTTYTQVANSYTGGVFDLQPNLFILPFFAIYVYPWIVAGPAVASEIKGKEAIRWNVPIAAILSTILLTAGFGAMYSVGGQGFTNAALANPTLVFNYSFNFWTLAMGVASSPAIAWLIGLGWIVWNIAILAYAVIIFARYVFAQAFDRYLPARFAYVSPNFSSPVAAHLIDLVLTVGFVAISAFLYGPLSSLFGVVLSAVIYFIFVGVAVTLYALRKEKGGAKSILAVCGILMSMFYVFLTYEYLGNPGVWGGNNFAYGYIIVSFIAGLVIYLASKLYYGKRGIDIGLAFKEIPPE
ncbi:MAG TPA: amino acid permease [Methylomirabilota bacterium]|nr:amino acid permease [Methylomirabilota bacterium]